VAVERRQMLTQPTQIKNMPDPTQQMICRDHLLQIKLVKQMALPVLIPTHHPDHPRFLTQNE
jgi:hypothetical protein